MSNDKFDTARQVLRQQKLTGERALFQSENLAVYDSVFENGESPLKESSSLYLDNCLFRCLKKSAAASTLPAASNIITKYPIILPIHIRSHTRSGSAPLPVIYPAAA